MTVEQLLDKYGGFTLSNKAYIDMGGKRVLVGRITSDKFELTEEGKAIVAAQVSIIVPEAPSPTTRKRSKSVQSTAE